MSRETSDHDIDRKENPKGSASTIAVKQFQVSITQANEGFLWQNHLWKNSSHSNAMYEYHHSVQHLPENSIQEESLWFKHSGRSWRTICKSVVVATTDQNAITAFFLHPHWPQWVPWRFDLHGSVKGGSNMSDTCICVHVPAHRHMYIHIIKNNQDRN